MLKRLLHKIFGRESDAQHKDLLPKSIVNFGLKTFSVGIGFYITMVLTNLLGKEDYGHFTYAFTWTSVLSLIAVLGFDRSTLREFARYLSDGQWSLMRAVFRWKDGLIIIGSLIITGIAYALSYLPLEMFSDAPTLRSFRLGLVLIPIMALLVHRRASLNGLKDVVVAQFPERIIQPLVFLAAIGVTVYIGREHLNAFSAILMSLGGFAIALLVADLILRRRWKSKPELVIPQGEKRRWLKLALPILIFNLSMMAFSRMDVLMLRPLADADAVGVYNIPLKLATYIGFILVSFNAVIAPNLSQTYKAGDREAMQRIISKASRYMLIFGILAAGALWLIHPWLLSKFGDGFEAGGTALVILIAGQLVNVVCGPVGNILVMSDREWTASLTFIAGTLLNFVLNLWLIPLYGIEGAAIATAISLAFANILMLIFVVWKVRVNPTALPFRIK